MSRPNSFVEVHTADDTIWIYHSPDMDISTEVAAAKKAGYEIVVQQWHEVEADLDVIQLKRS